MENPPRADRTSGSLREDGWALGVVWAAAGALGLLYLRTGWIPDDDGPLAHAAERVLSGELPHRDFIETYTGALTYVHALAFETFGVRLTSLRWALFTAYMLWIPCVYGIVRRVWPSALAACATGVVAAFTIPNYPASMPSWYTLFLGTATAAALLVWWDRRSRGWLVLAGLAAGAAIAIKITGLYLVAGGLLALLLMDQEEALRAGAGSGLGVIVGLFAVLYAALVLMLVVPLLSAAGVVHFLLPAAALAALVIRREWYLRGPSASPGLRSSRLARMAGAVGLFLVGVAIPVSAWIGFYAAQGALEDLVHGVLVLPRKRLDATILPPPHLGSLPFLLLLPALVLWARSVDRRWPPAGRWLLAGGLAAALLASGHPWAFIATWLTIHNLPAVGVLCVMAGLLWWEGEAGRACTVEVLVLTAMLVPMLLVQHPFAAPIYALYVAPIALLLLVVAAERWPIVRRSELVMILLFYALFLGWRGHGGRLMYQAQHPVADAWPAKLALDRGGIRVSARDKEDFEVAVELLRAHGAGAPIYAAPDGPILYFLSGLENPTPNLYDLFSDPVSVPVLMQLLETRGVRAVAVRTRTCCWSDPPTPELLSALAARFPEEREVGSFLIRWRR